MSVVLSFFKYKKFYFILFFIFTSFLIAKKHSSIKTIKKKCEFGEEYIKGHCTKISFDKISEAKIDEDGVFKYIQIKCNENYIYIRGSKDCKYHKYIYNKFLNEINNNHLDKNLCKCLGGGRIKKSIKEKKIKIYGYSKTFGRIKNQHEITKQILQKYYPEYEITWTNEGY